MSEGAASVTPARVVVMGVAGSGKTTIGAAMAERLDVAFVDGDGLHPDENVAKMAREEPLTDGDRWPWLARVRTELRRPGGAVVACSALARRYRDHLRGAEGVRFVFLDLDEATATARLQSRTDHYMRASMVASQFAALERPTSDEVDVIRVDATDDVDDMIGRVVGLLAGPASVPQPLVADGAPTRDISIPELAAHLGTIVDLVVARGARRVLVVPPDHTRLHSRAGEITVLLREQLRRRGCEVVVLPALGTHVPLTDHDARLLFGNAVDVSEILVHDWRHGLRELGELSAAEVGAVTGGRFTAPIPVAVDEQLVNGWDVVVSIGQVVPHEVIGMANFTKNLVIGLGGAPTIHRTHFVGAVCDMESIMGRTSNPVRDLVDAAFDRFVEPLVPVVWILTVVEDCGGRMTTRGLFAGEGSSAGSGGAAFRRASELARQVNVELVDEPWSRVVCWLDPQEMRSTWLGCKAIYRTRMAMADGGELLVLAPGVERFGEDPVIDELIRRHGYRGSSAVLEALEQDPELAANLAAGAHLIHGSSEGRFRIVWCTDPRAGGLGEDDVRAVGWDWRWLPEVLAELGVDGSTPSGPRLDAAGGPFTFLQNPAAGLWSTAERFGGPWDRPDELNAHPPPAAVSSER